MKRAGSGREQDVHAAVHRWARVLFDAATAFSESPPDLSLNAITAILGWRIFVTRFPGLNPVQDIVRLEDLAAVAVELNADLAADLTDASGRGTPVSFDARIADVWIQTGVSSLSLSGHDILGMAHQSILALADVASGRRSRKLGGVFFTPPDVVDTIVRRTVAAGRGTAGAPAILDPACGSGAFLLGAYARLRCRGSTRPASEGARSAESLIYGIDADPRAVRLARMNLKLAVWKDEEPRRRRGMEEILSRRIVAGSSLEEPGSDRPIPSAIEESFPEVMNRGGFDVVIGNPPYVKNKDLATDRKRLWKKTYACARGQFDLMVLFLEKGMEVLKPGGRLGFVVSNKFMTADYGRAVRDRILETCRIEEIVDLSQAGVFRAAAIYPTILILRKKASPGRPRGNVLLRDGVVDPVRRGGGNSIPQSFFDERPGRILTPSITRPLVRVLGKIEARSRPLGDMAAVGCGLATPGMGRALLSGEEAAGSEDPESVHRFIRVENIRPYEVRWSGRWIRLDPERHSASRLSDFRKRKVVIPGVRPGLQAAYDTRGYVLGRVYYLTGAQMDHRLLLALLNSSVLGGYYRTLFGAVRMAGGFLRFNGPYLRALPIPSNLPDRSRTRIVDLVRERLRMGRRPVASAKARSTILRLEADIDGLVCDLYGLTQTERSVISASR